MKNTLFHIILFFLLAGNLFAQNQELTLSFSAERGFYENPFSVTIMASESGAQIFYTLDGRRPDATSTLYTQPIPINTTTPLSVIAYYGTLVSPIITHTYLFINDIKNQPANPAGFPAVWGPLDLPMGGYSAGQNAPADYAMDAAVINNPAYTGSVNQAFTSIPFVSLVTDTRYVFSHSLDADTGGIYIHTGWNANGAEWERPCSIEFYEQATGKQFQQNCGLRLHGGNSRKPSNSGKHSFRVSFRTQYGKGKLRFPVFDDASATQRFDHLVLRAGYNYSWVKNSDEQQRNAQYVYDSFAKRTQLDMGQIGCHDMFVHLFVNGLYWGLYDISEKINDNHLDAYLGGADLDYDVINDDGVVDGNNTLFNRMVDLAKSGDNAKYNQLVSENLLYLENFIDYMLLNFYIGNNDWGTNNWFAGINRINHGDGFRFFVWDAETAFTDVNINKIKGNNGVEGTLRTILFGSTNKTSTSSGLFKIPAFKALFAQRAGLHLLGAGALTPTKAAERYTMLCDEIDLPIILESARWGDYRSTTLPHNLTRVTYTRNEHWLPRKQALLQSYFPQRTNILISQLAEIGITPAPSAITETQAGEITVYFADNHLFYNIPQDSDVALEVFSIDGKKVFAFATQHKLAGLYNENLSHLSTGIYIYRLTYNNQVFTEKIVK
ncbi:MAG: chitobiase/beta-hexosaminidase C-terminal domain-containing protein [Paludibacter sp.]|jgi:hypothetical protein|nr:chitobiase/beta-hexosaminidase C-terminal domain-containing protein [Paludibacter sp.]